MRSRLAHASWIIPLIAMAVPALTRPGGPPSSEAERGQLLGSSCAQFVAYIIGFAAAILALRSRDSREGEKTLPSPIKIPALVGLALNGLLLALMLWALAWWFYIAQRDS